MHIRLIIKLLCMEYQLSTIFLSKNVFTKRDTPKDFPTW